MGVYNVCIKYGITYELLLEDLGNSYEENKKAICELASYLDKKYQYKKKGIFLANDTYANIFLNWLIRMYGCLPDNYRLIGFDNSPISSEAVIPTSTIGQQIDKIAEAAMELLVAQKKGKKESQCH